MFTCSSTKQTNKLEHEIKQTIKLQKLYRIQTMEQTQTTLTTQNQTQANKLKQQTAIEREIYPPFVILYSAHVVHGLPAAKVSLLSMKKS